MLKFHACRTLITSEFSSCYQRNNKNSGKKNMRCFPHCNEKGHKKSFCGSSVKVVFQARLGLFGNGSNKSEIVAGAVKKLYCFAQLNEESESSLVPQQEIPISMVEQNVRDRRNPFNMYILGTYTGHHFNQLCGSCDTFSTEQNNLNSSCCELPLEESVLNMEFAVNHEPTAWHYGCALNKGTCNRNHHIVTYICERIVRNGIDTLVVLAKAISPKWKLFCIRRKHRPDRFTHPVVKDVPWVFDEEDVVHPPLPTPDVLPPIMLSPVKNANILQICKNMFQNEDKKYKKYKFPVHTDIKLEDIEEKQEEPVMVTPKNRNSNTFGSFTSGKSNRKKRSEADTPLEENIPPFHNRSSSHKKQCVISSLPLSPHADPRFQIAAKLFHDDALTNTRLTNYASSTTDSNDSFESKVDRSDYEDYISTTDSVLTKEDSHLIDLLEDQPSTNTPNEMQSTVLESTCLDFSEFMDKESDASCQIAGNETSDPILDLWANEEPLEAVFTRRCSLEPPPKL